MKQNWDTRTADSCKLPELMGNDYCNDCRDYAYCEAKGQFMKQITIFDILEPDTKEVPCGYIDDLSLIGRELRFSELKDMIGKKCIVTNHTESQKCYKVVKIIAYFVDCDKVYKQVRELPENDIGYGDKVNDYIHDVVGIKECMDCYEVDYICDRVAFTDKENGKEANCWVSEMYCSNGRFEPLYGKLGDTFYELRY